VNGIEVMKIFALRARPRLRPARCKDLKVVLVAAQIGRSAVAVATSSAVRRKACYFGDRTLVSCPRNSMYFVAIKMGCRQGARSGAYLNRYVTDEQRGRRPIFIATLRAGASWPFFCVALSARLIQIWALVRALKNSQLTSGKIYVISGTGH
jgi:hypothetical protein